MFAYWICILKFNIFQQIFLQFPAMTHIFTGIWLPHIEKYVKKFAGKTHAAGKKLNYRKFLTFEGQSICAKLANMSEGKIRQKITLQICHAGCIWLNVKWRRITGFDHFDSDVLHVEFVKWDHNKKWESLNKSVLCITQCASKISLINTCMLGQANFLWNLESHYFVEFLPTSKT